MQAESDLDDLPEALDVRLKAEEFQNYAQQMENAVLSLAISIEEVLKVYIDQYIKKHPDIMVQHCIQEPTSTTHNVLQHTWERVKYIYIRLHDRLRDWLIFREL